MKWTQEFVWDKVEEVLPNARLSHDALPEALKDAAVELFMGDSEFDCSYAAYVIKTALTELRKHGYMEFGNINVNWG